MKISIAMCTFNGARYLEEQLESIAKQSHLPFELVVCDDGSTDKTMHILRHFQENSPFAVRVFQNQERLGYARNFMRCAHLTSGDVICFCDQDDVWTRNKLSECIPHLANSRSYFVYHNAMIFSDRRAEGHLYRKRLKSDQALGLATNFFALGFTMMFRRELLALSPIIPSTVGYGGENSSLSHDEWISFIADICGPVTYVDKTLAQYRRHDNNISLRKRNALASRMVMIARAADRVANYELFLRTMSVALSNCKTKIDADGYELFERELRTAADALETAANLVLCRVELYKLEGYLSRSKKIISNLLAGVYSRNSINRSGGKWLVIDLAAVFLRRQIQG